MGDHDLGLPAKARHSQQDLVAEVGVALDGGPLVGVERAGLVEDGIRDPDLAHIVEQAGAGECPQLVCGQLHCAPDLDGKLGNAGVMPLGVLVLRLDRGGKRGDRLGMFELDTDLDLQLERGFHHLAKRESLRSLRREC